MADKESAPMQAAPQKEHLWLQRLVGDWVTEMDASMGPDTAPAKHRGSERVHSIGGLWIQCEGTGEMPGGDTATMLMTLGYDPQKRRFVGTWLGSMMTHLWIYEGQLDESERVLTLNAEGPTMRGDGTMAKYQDIIEIVSDTERSLTSRQLQPDGSWKQFMTARYRRKS